MVKRVTFIVYKLYFNFLKGEEREKENISRSRFTGKLVKLKFQDPSTAWVLGGVLVSVLIKFFMTFSEKAPFFHCKCFKIY